MLLYMFAAHKYNYSRYGLFYVRSMSWIPPDIKEKLINGEQSFHHTAGLWNGEPTDQCIETTWMRKGHGPSGVIGNTENPQTMATWIFSQDAVMTLTDDLKAIGTTDVNIVKLHHKEEERGRIKRDNEDRNSLKEALKMFIDPLDTSSHKGGLLLNIVTGKVANPEVNVDKALPIGESIITEFEASWPDGFYAPIHKKIMTFADYSRIMKFNGQLVPDPETIYQRVIGIVLSDRGLNYQEVFGTELNTFSTAMFKDDGTMRLAENKSSLKNMLQVGIPEQCVPTPNVLIADVSQYLWGLQWPKAGRIEAIIAQFKVNIEEMLK